MTYFDQVFNIKVLHYTHQYHIKFINSFSSLRRTYIKIFPWLFSINIWFFNKVALIWQSWDWKLRLIKKSNQSDRITNGLRRRPDPVQNPVW